MIRLEENTTLIGVAELRKEVPRLIQELRGHKVVLTRRNKPVGIIMDYHEYQKMDRIINLLEDLVLGYKAKLRSRHKGRHFISLEEAERRVGLK